MDENKISDEWALETLKTFTASIMENEGEVSPRFIVMCVDAMITVPSLARDDREKDAMAAVVKLVTMATAAYAVAFVGEAWIAVYSLYCLDSRPLFDVDKCLQRR